MELAKDDRIDVSEAMTFARKKLFSFFWGPIVPCLGIIFFVLCLMLGGAIGQIPFLGPLLVGLFFFLGFLAAFLILFIAIGGAVGPPVMFATIAMEGTDAFDAISRAYSYVFGRPWRLIWYALVALAYGLAVTVFVFAFTLGILWATVAIGGWAMGKGFEPIGTFLSTGSFPENTKFIQGFAGYLIKAQFLILLGLAAGFVISYKAAATTIIYSLLRKAVDGTDMTEVYLEEEEEALEAGAEAEAKPAEGEPPTPPAPEKPAEPAGGEDQEA